MLGPQTVRRLACDAGIIPAVLAGTGQILDLGGYRRAFTSAQVRALWLRDRHRTYPGCTVPGTWADAHHIRHWADGGPTDLDRVLAIYEGNASSMCAACCRLNTPSACGSATSAQACSGSMSARLAANSCR